MRSGRDTHRLRRENEPEFQRIDWRVRTDTLDLFCDELHERFGCSIETLESDPEGYTHTRFYLTGAGRLRETRAFLSEFSQRVMSENTVPLVEEIAAKDWERSYRDSVKPERVSETILVRPTWAELSPEELRGVQHEIVIDPQMAFGSGSHGSTQLCMRALEKLVSRGHVVADVGCGSGILSILAAKLGASRVDAVDIETIAVTTCRTNARINGVADTVNALTGSVDAMNDEPMYDIIVANILLNVNLELLPQFVRRLKPGGALALSGLLIADESEMVEALQAQCMCEPSRITQGEWLALVCHKSIESSEKV